MSTPKIVALSAGVGDPSTTRMLADRLAAAASAEVGGASVEVVNLRELAHEIDALHDGQQSWRHDGRSAPAR